MATRSIIAELLPDGKWRGRYCHWDGYPSAKLPQLAHIVARDGADVARKTLLHDNWSWSSIDSADKSELPSIMQDGRFKIVPGYGVTHTDLQETSDVEWFMEGDYEQGWCEYLYIIHDDRIECRSINNDGSTEPCEELSIEAFKEIYV
jgi:hypothetical protein